MKLKKLMALVLVCSLLASCGVTVGKKGYAYEVSPDATIISLSDDGIMVNDAEVSGENTEAVYISNDIVYYKNGTDFTYGEGSAEDMHTEEEASAHTVLNITKPGEYIVSGKLSKGQIAVDLGDEAEDDPNARVTLVLNGVDITCSVAPAVIFYNVYECGDDDEDAAKADVDTSGAGANVVIADNSVNTLNGAYVAKIYKSVELNEAKTEVVDSKKLHKYDGTLYSKMSMNIYAEKEGNGILNINAENEGLDTELHLTIYGGNINIISANDGINTNEDGVSVTSIKGGILNIKVTGETGEGDGIDSNGWLVIEGGTVNAYACADSMDSGVDADKGIYIRGGNVVATGNMLDRIDEGATYVTFMFMEKQKGGKVYSLKNAAGEKVLDINTENDFTQLVVSSDELSEGEYTFWCEDEKLYGAQGGMGMGGFPGGGPRPDGGEMPMDGKFPKPEDMPDGNFKKGEHPGGEMPERPKDFPNDRAFGKRGDIPEGNFKNGEFPNGERPEGMNGGRQRPQNGAIERMNFEFSEIFEIREGANSFMVRNKA